LADKLQIASVVGGAVGLVTTILRLFFRRRRLWWDDAFALVSMLFLILHVGALFIFVLNEPANVSRSLRIAAFYTGASTFYAVIWFARLSILFSIIRLDTIPGQRNRFLFVAAGFALAGVLLLAQLFWVCVPDATWRKLPIPQCPLDTQIVACQLISDVVSDCILIIAPVKLFQNILDKGLRRRLILIFSAAIMTTIVSTVHAAFILSGKGIQNLIAATIEISVSLVVCNFPVFAVATIRFREVKSKQDDSLETSTPIEEAETIITMRSY